MAAPGTTPRSRTGSRRRSAIRSECPNVATIPASPLAASYRILLPPTPEAGNALEIGIMRRSRYGLRRSATARRSPTNTATPDTTASETSAPPPHAHGPRPSAGLTERRVRVGFAQPHVGPLDEHRIPDADGLPAALPRPIPGPRALLEPAPNRANRQVTARPARHRSPRTAGQPVRRTDKPGRSGQLDRVSALGQSRSQAYGSM